MLKIKDRKYFLVRLLSRIYIFLILGSGGDGEEAAQKHSVFLPTGEQCGEDTTHSRARTRLTSRGRKRRRGRKKYGLADPGIWDS